MSAIQESAMIARLSIGQWNATKLDRRTSSELTQSKHAKEKAGKVYKTLVDSEHLAAFQRTADDARFEHYRLTLPWEDGAYRLLPVTVFDEWSQAMRKHKAKALQHARDFVDGYDQAITNAKDLLGDWFDEADYPPADSVLKRFRFDTTLTPVPDSGDWRVDLSEKEIAELTTAAEQRVQEALSEATTDLWNRAYWVVEHMLERLDDPEKKFKNSLIENARDIASLLPKMNVTGDPELAKLSQEINLKLCGHAPDTLRADKDVRKNVAKNAKDLLKTVEKYATVRAAS